MNKREAKIEALDQIFALVLTALVDEDSVGWRDGLSPEDQAKVGAEIDAFQDRLALRIHRLEHPNNNVRETK